MNALNSIIGSLVAANTAVERVEESTRAAWDDEARAAFDRTHWEPLRAAASRAVRELQSIADAAAKLEAQLGSYR